MRGVRIIKKYIFLFIVSLITLTFILVKPVNAQMMGGFGNKAQFTPSQSDLQDEQNIQDAGQKIYQNLQTKKITCQKLTSDDYEKLGEYFMGQAAGSTQNHVYWDQHIQSMMGDQGDTQMHIVWGERGSGCATNAHTPSYITGMMGSQNIRNGGGFSMMGWGGYGYGNMMNGNFGWGFGIFHFIIATVVLIDLILAGMWLWKQLQKK